MFGVIQPINTSISADIRTARRANLRRLLNPRHVAFIGGRALEPAIEMTKTSGFRGAIWPVNPKYPEIAGVPTFKSVQDLPEAPDAAFLYVSKALTPGIIGALASRGGGGAVCFAAGYAELGEDGQRLQRELAETAGTLALIGPNSTGFLNCFDDVALWPVHDHRVVHRDSGVAIVSQSGGVLFNYSINQRSVVAGYMIGVGNQAVLDYSDYIDVLIDDDRVRAIGLFMEEIGDAVSFSRSAARALSKNVPIVVVKTGASEVGARMAQTHSGALVASDALFDALFDRTGVVRVHSLAALDESLKLLTTTRAPRGRRIALLTNSGGEKALAADAAARTVLEFPQPSVAVADELRKQIPPFAVVSNPFDYNAYFSGENVLSSQDPVGLERCFRTMLEDPYDIAVMLAGFRTHPDGHVEQRDATLSAWIAANKDSGRAAVLTSVLPEHLPAQHRDYLIAHGIAPLQGLDEAMAAIDGAVRRSERLHDLANAPIEIIALPPVPDIAATRELLDEWHSKRALASFGLTAPLGLAATIADAPRAAAEIGFPVAVKALKPLIAHKARVGAVVLNLRSTGDVESAVASIGDRLAKEGLTLTDVLVERMVESPVLELIVGVDLRERFGHTLVFGLGGGAVEVSRNVRTTLLPIGEAALERFVRASDCVKSLNDGVAQGVVKAVAAITRYVDSHRTHVVSLDVNPLIVTKSGDVVAADALIEGAYGIGGT